jgi:hypothetical protein
MRPAAASAPEQKPRRDRMVVDMAFSLVSAPV